jgi:hypothetical protein
MDRPSRVEFITHSLSHVCPYIMFWEDSTSCNLQLSQNGQHLLVFTTWNDNSE